MPPVVNRAWRELVASLDHPHMLTQDLTLRGDYQPVRINAQTDGTVRKCRRNAIAVAFKADQASGRHSLAQFDKAIEGAGNGISAACSAAQTSETLPSSVACGISPHNATLRCSSQSFSATRSGKLGIGCHSRRAESTPLAWCRASCAFFSTCPFSQPAAGLQNSGSNT